MEKLTQKQKAFADEYLAGKSQTQAYKSAYSTDMSDDVAAVCASQLLRNPKVKGYVEKRMADASSDQSKRIATADEVLSFLTSVMRGEVQDRCTTTDRLKASELLGKRHSLFTDKLEVKGSMNIADTLKKARERAGKHG